MLFFQESRDFSHKRFNIVNIKLKSIGEDVLDGIVINGVEAAMEDEKK